MVKTPKKNKTRPKYSQISASESEDDEDEAEEYSRGILRLRELSDDDDSELEEARENIVRFNQGRKFAEEKKQSKDGGKKREKGKGLMQEDNAEVEEDGYATNYPTTSEYASYETSDTEENDSAMRRKAKFPIHNPREEKPDFELSMLFGDMKEFNGALQKYALKERIEYVFTKNCKEYVRATCKKELCPWKISAAFVLELNCVQVKTLVEPHDCNPTFKNARIPAKWLAANTFKDMTSISKMSLEEMKQMVKKELQIEVSHVKCQRARTLVVKELRGDETKEYAKLWDYAAELEKSNPGTTIDLMVDTPALGRGIPEFEKMYITFDCCKRDFLAGCRHLIGLDGCFLKGVVKSEILAAVGRDANNQMFPIAWGVVLKESTETWTWFLKLLKKDLGIADGDGWAFISDEQKGLTNAIDNQFPKAEKRLCGRHKFANWRKTHKGVKLHRLLWECVKATYEEELTFKMKELKEVRPKAHEAMLKTKKEKWCKTYFNPDLKIDVVDNNLCEAFNGKIVFARSKAIITMLEDIRIYIMRRLRRNKDLGVRWNGEIGPRIKRKLRENMKESGSCIVEWNGSDGYEIKHKRVTHVVKLDKWTCSYRAWMLSGITCPHALCAIEDSGEDPVKYISSWYKKEKYLEAYQYMMQPVAGEKFWPATGKEPMLPPPFRKTHGRPQIKRRREEWEQSKVGASRTRMSRKGEKHICKTCKKSGHNSRTCPQKPRPTAVEVEGENLDQEAQGPTDHIAASNESREEKHNNKGQSGGAQKKQKGKKGKKSKQKEVISQPQHQLPVEPISASNQEESPMSFLVAPTQKKISPKFKHSATKIKNQQTDDYAVPTQGSQTPTANPNNFMHIHTTSNQSDMPLLRNSYIVITPQQLVSQCEAKKKNNGKKRKAKR